MFVTLSVPWFQRFFARPKETRGENREPLVTSGPYPLGAVRLIINVEKSSKYPKNN
jgi:hypothetical protein